MALTLLPDLTTTSYSEYTFRDLELLYIFAQSEKYSMLFYMHLLQQMIAKKMYTKISYLKNLSSKVDCMAEIIFAKYLIYNNSYDELYVLQKSSYDNKFMHVYARIIF